MQNLLRVVLTMTDLKKTSAIVEHLLRKNKQTRNSDSYLYLKVLEYLDDQREDSVSYQAGGTTQRETFKECDIGGVVKLLGHKKDR